MGSFRLVGDEGDFSAVSGSDASHNIRWEEYSIGMAWHNLTFIPVQYADFFFFFESKVILYNNRKMKKEKKKREKISLLVCCFI